MADKQATSLLEGIDSPEDLKKIPADQIPALASEIRDFLIHRVKENGGHLPPRTRYIHRS